MPELEIVIVIVIGITALVLPAVLFLKANDKYKSSAQKCLCEILGNVEKVESQKTFVFHTYYGLVFEAIQIRHGIPYQHSAEKTIAILEKLYKFNKKWSIISYGCLWIRVLSFFEYRKNKKRIKNHFRIA